MREKVYRDSDVFDSLISGFLRLGNLKSAVIYIKAALRERQWISARTFYCVVKVCVDTLDYRAGLSLLRGLLRQGEDSTSTIIRSGLGRLAIRHLFALCGIRPSLHSERWEKPLPRMVSSEAIKSLLRRMRIESLDSSIDRFSARIEDVRRALGVDDFRLAPKSNGFAVEEGDNMASPAGKIDIRGLKKATKILCTASHFERHRSRQRHMYEEQHTMLRSADTTNCKPWLLILYQKLPGKWKKVYDDSIELIPDSSWSDRLELLASFNCGQQMTPGHPIYLKLRERSQQKLEPPLRRQWEGTRVEESQVNVANTEQTTVELELPNQENSEVCLPSRSKRQHDNIAVEISLPTRSIPQAPSTPALTIPLAATHDSAQLDATAVCHIRGETESDLIHNGRVSMMFT